MDKPASAKQAEIEVYNGEILGKDGPALRTTWNTANPLKLTVRYSKPRPWKNDRTVLRIKLPSGGFGVAVDDLLANDCVYVKDFGVFATREPAPVTLAQYRKQIAGRKTILQQVREMPDQTFQQAIKSLRRPDANLGPTLLSLACDNHKFLQHRTGQIDFEKSPEIINCADRCPTSQYSCSLRVEAGSGKREDVTRSLAEGWMPIPTITLDETGVLYRQRTFVAPLRHATAARGRPHLAEPQASVRLRVHNREHGTQTAAGVAQADLVVRCRDQHIRGHQTTARRR